MMTCVTEETKQLSQCGQSAVGQAGMPPVSLCTRSQTHPPARTLLHSAHRAFRSNMFLFQLARGGDSSENHDLEIKCEPKKSNRHKGGKQSQPLVTLF